MWRRQELELGGEEDAGDWRGLSVLTNRLSQELEKRLD